MNVAFAGSLASRCFPRSNVGHCRQEDRLLRQGIWTGGGGSVFSAHPAQLQQLLLRRGLHRWQALAEDDTPVNATDSNSTDANATNSSLGADANATAAAEASASAANETQAGAPWSYFALTPLDMAPDWVLGESASSDRLHIDRPPLLRVSPCRAEYSQRWWRECPAGRRRQRLCGEVALQADAESASASGAENGTGPAGNSSGREAGGGGANGSEPAMGTSGAAADNGTGAAANGTGAATLWAALGCQWGPGGGDGPEEGSPEWWGSAAGGEAWSGCRAAGFGSLYWNQKKCWLARFGPARHSGAAPPLSRTRMLLAPRLR